MLLLSTYRQSAKKSVDRRLPELITQYMVKDILYLLRNSQKSIKEIANELNFPNLSFFGKYVKQHLGMSPKQYRESSYG